MSNQNTEKSSGIEFALFSRTCEMGMNNFGCLNSSLSSFYYYAYNEPPPSPPTRDSTLLAGPPVLSPIVPNRQLLTCSKLTIETSEQGVKCIQS